MGEPSVTEGKISDEEDGLTQADGEKYSYGFGKATLWLTAHGCWAGRKRLAARGSGKMTKVGYIKG